MKFICEDDQFVELKILGYQFPEILNDEWDSNWLIIFINAKSKDTLWNATDPSITTFEFKKLISWFENISNNNIEKFKIIDFTEPNLTFELLNNFNAEIKEIKIKFKLELNPKPYTNFDEEYSIKFRANNEIIKKYTEELKIELEKYPER
jgi:hypothetical protein